MNEHDVPITVDFRCADHAQAWANTAASLRPWRADFFAAFVAAIAERGPERCRVLELGSGPGFLAERLLAALPGLAYVGLDFSAAMHALARERVAAHAARTTFLERDLKDAGWGAGLGPFDHVLTHQVVHELRHKRHAVALHAQVRERLLPGGSYLVCDHHVGDGGMADERLYMTADEQREALHRAGFGVVELLLQTGGLVLHRARDDGDGLSRPRGPAA